jgi:predicted NAD-dependent protein-ADP-ribosyltransferase YbiA (DUF1768 family)
MAAYLDCETCFRLWAEYGAAATGVKALTAERMLEAADAQKTVDEAIRSHEAESHSAESHSKAHAAAAGGF